MVIISHAGCAGHAPANTISSIQKALELDVDMIEFDVHRCKTGEIILMHDATVNRTTDGRGKIKDMTLAQLKELTVEQTEPVSILPEALDVIDTRAEVNIELKSVDSAGPVAEIILQYTKERGWELDDFLISSFKIKALEIFRAHHATAKIGVLTNSPSGKTLKIAKRLRAYSINAKHTSISESFLRNAQRSGYKVFAFTADDLEDIEHLKTMGVDGIFCDYPERL